MNLVAPVECSHVENEDLGIGIANSLLALPANDENGNQKLNILIGVHWQPSDINFKVPFISFHAPEELEFLGLVTPEENNEEEETEDTNSIDAKKE